MKILMISGTYNRKSKTWLMLDEARKHCENDNTQSEANRLEAVEKIETEIVELCDYAITIGQQDTTRNLSELVEKIKQADALIFSTPNYQGSMSGLLKVAIDHIPEAGLKNKAVGLIAVSGGIGRMSLPTSHLRDVVTALEGLAVSTDIACYADDFIRDENGHNLISNEKIADRLQQLVLELKKVTIGLKSA